MKYFVVDKDFNVIFYPYYLQCNFLLIITWLPTYESMVVPFFFSLRLIPIDFIFVHNYPNYMFLSILGTKNMVIHNLQIVNNVYKNFNPTPHLFGHWSPHLYESCCVLFLFFCEDCLQ